MITTPFSKLENKTGKHKDWYGPEFVKIFCSEINPKNNHFKNSSFISAYEKGYKPLELKERLHFISKLLLEHLKMDYKDQIEVLSSLLSDPWPNEEGMFTYGFFLYPVSQFVEINGTKDIDTSLKFIERLTQQFTGEFAIRPLANHDEKKVLSQMKLWASHKNFHVRRLASEGLRARLPWGMKIDWIDKNPEKSLPIYDKLRNDKVLYVRRSVANSIGDLIKINEDLAHETLRDWLKTQKTQENLWVIRHAIRNPIKKKNKKFLSLDKEIRQYMEDL